MPNKELTIIDGPLTVAGQVFDPLPEFDEIFTDFGPIGVSPLPPPPTPPLASPPPDDLAASGDEDVGDPQWRVRQELAEKLEKEGALPSGKKKAPAAPAKGKKTAKAQKGKAQKGRGKKAKQAEEEEEDDDDDDDVEMGGGGGSEEEWAPQQKYDPGYISYCVF